MWIDGGLGNGWDGRVVNYELTRPLTEAERLHALGRARAVLLPCSRSRLLAELARLRTLTVSRDPGAADLELIFAAYADELADYAEDAIVDVLRGWAKTERFWPSLAELTPRLDRLVSPRQALLRAIERGYREPEVSPDWIPPTAAEKAEVHSMLEKHGLVVDATTGKVRPVEPEVSTAEHLRIAAASLKGFRLPDEDDPRVQARLREMGVTA